MKLVNINGDKVIRPSSSSILSMTEESSEERNWKKNWTLRWNPFKASLSSSDRLKNINAAKIPNKDSFPNHWIALDRPIWVAMALRPRNWNWVSGGLEKAANSCTRWSTVSWCSSFRRHHRRRHHDQSPAAVWPHTTGNGTLFRFPIKVPLGMERLCRTVTNADVMFN